MLAIMDLHWLWEGLLTHWIVTLLTLGGGVMLAVLDRKKPRWRATALYGLAGCALVAVTLFAFVAFTSLPKETPQITPDNVEATIRTWLDRRGVSTKRFDDADMLWALVVTLEDGNPIEISRPKSPDQYVLVETAIDLSDEHKAQVGKLSNEETEQLAGELKLEMARAKMGYTRTQMTKFTLTRIIPINKDLTESSLVDKINDVDAAVALVEQTIMFALNRHAAKSKH